MLDFAYLHEDMVNTIEELMNEWGKEKILYIAHKGSFPSTIISICLFAFRKVYIRI